MPAKTRVAKLRRPEFSDEALALFRQLEGVPERMRRDNDEFKAQDRRLHKLLGLWGPRLCTQVSVLDREEPSWVSSGRRPPEAIAEARQVHAVRLALLEAAAAYTISGSSGRPAPVSPEEHKETAPVGTGAA